MANTGVKGIDILQTGVAVISEAFFTTSGAAMGTGTATLEILEMQSDGTVKSYDFNDNTFKTTACTTYTANMTHRSANNSTVTTGIWTYSLTTLTGLTVGAVYTSIYRLTSADNPVQSRKWQYGSAEGDLATTVGSTGVAAIQADMLKISGTIQTAGDIYGTTVIARGTATAGGSNTITIASSVGANSIINGNLIAIVSGTGAGQTKTIIAYTNSTLLTVVDSNWITNPDGTSVYVIYYRHLPKLDPSQQVSAATVGTCANLTNAPTSGDFTAAMKASITVAVPSIAGIVTGLLTDLLTSSDFSTAGSFGKLLKDNVDATVSSRLAASSYTAPTTPPTAVAIRTEMDSNSSKLSNLDTPISSRLAASGYTTPPTIAAIVTALLTDLLTSSDFSTDDSFGKLLKDNIDATVSSRLAASSYVAPTAPPTAVAIRSEMDSNSTKLAAIATGDELGAAKSAILAAVGSPLQSMNYSPPPSAESVAAQTASVLFVDGATNQLKVNSDHTVTLTDGADPIVNYITIPAAVALGSQAPTLITCLRGDTLRISLPLLGDVTNRTKMVMTAKTNVNDTDGEAALQITEAMGLVRLNGGAYGNSELANLIVRDATTGVVDVTIDAKVTSLLEIGDMVWDVQVFLVSGIVSPISGTLSVVADVTQAVV